LKNNYETSDSLIYLLENVKDTRLINILQNKLNNFLPSLVLSIPDIDIVFKLANSLYRLFGISESIFFNLINSEEIVIHVSSLVQDRFDETLDDLLETADDTSLPYSEMRNFTELRDRLREYEFYIDVDYSTFNDYDWTDITIENHIQRLINEDD
jgi:hypothetical protein